MKRLLIIGTVLLMAFLAQANAQPQIQQQAIVSKADVVLIPPEAANAEA